MPKSKDEFSQEEKLTPTGRKKVEWTTKKIVMVIIFTLVVIISVAVLVWTFIDKTFLFSLIRDYFILPLLDIGWWAYLVFLVLMIIQSLIAPIPSELVLLSAGMIFGLWPGMAIGVVGSVVSGVVTYFLAVKGGRPIIESAGEYVSLADKFIKVVDIWIERWGIWAIIVGRAVPLIMFDPVSYAAGLSNIKWKPYTLATFIGSIPRAIFFAILGSSMIDPGETDIAAFIRNLSPEEFEQVAGQFNLIFYIIFGVLVLMLVIASLLSNRIAKKKELEEKDTETADQDKSEQEKIVTKEEVEKIDSDMKD
ncbi:MAG: TVP38/TMEM64 family protein [Candidatus Heimdallarchaeota archaeon]|nr:TVP38/TMEM64 family protein [Candidatus Heimdallarchaeota archaeon]MCK5409701.1 TVP38/TMEM64 family protein [Candidatus Heimdallarchaeota archaeon]